MQLVVPDFSLIVLIGASGAGKSSFARRHFLATEIVSSDQCRALVSDDETDQSATADAFELVAAIAAKRLARRKLTVIDATSVKPEDRKKLIDLARRYHALPSALVFDLPEEICLARNAARGDRRCADTSHEEPEDATEDGEQEHDQDPDRLADAAMARRRLNSTVDDGENPESGQHQRQDQQHSGHTPILGAHAGAGPVETEL